MESSLNGLLWRWAGELGCHNRGFNLFTFTVESDLLPYGLEFLISCRGNCFWENISICLIEAFVKPIIQARDVTIMPLIDTTDLLNNRKWAQDF